MEKDRPDLRKPVHVCERKIKDCYKKLNILTQEVADCNLKIDEHHKRKNTKLDFANEYRIQRKNLEQKAECFGRKADSFCLKGLMDREVNGFKSTNLCKADSFCLKGLIDREVNGLKSTKDILRLANNNAWKQVYTKKDALRCEESAIKLLADATESENKVNEFTIKKVTYRLRNINSKEACPNGKRVWQKRKKMRE